MMPSDSPFSYLIRPGREARAAAREKREEKWKARKAKEQARLDAFPRGVGLTSESFNKIVAVITAILKNDADYAYFINGVGFNAGDSKIFHELFDTGCYDSYELMKNVHRLKKYRRQYKAIGFTDEDITPRFNEPKKKQYDLSQFL
jgi:hypothetical protein